MSCRRFPAFGAVAAMGMCLFAVLGPGPLQAEVLGEPRSVPSHLPRAAVQAEATSLWWLFDEPCGDARLVVTSEWIHCRDGLGWLHGPSTTFARLAAMDPLRIRHEHYHRGLKHGPETVFTPTGPGESNVTHRCEIEWGQYHGACEFYDLLGNWQNSTRFHRGSGLFLRYQIDRVASSELWLYGEAQLSWWQVGQSLVFRIGARDAVVQKQSAVRGAR